MTTVGELLGGCMPLGVYGSLAIMIVVIIVIFECVSSDVVTGATIAKLGPPSDQIIVV